MLSKRSFEGYLLIDHRDSPGISRELAWRTGMLPIEGGTRLETATNKCHVCERMIIMNPKRTRERAYCPKHDAYLCDLCEAERVRTGVCRPMQQVIDEHIEAHLRKGV